MDKTSNNSESSKNDGSKPQEAVPIHSPQPDKVQKTACDKPQSEGVLVKRPQADKMSQDKSSSNKLQTDKQEKTQNLTVSMVQLISYLRVTLFGKLC